MAAILSAVFTGAQVLETVGATIVTAAATGYMADEQGDSIGAAEQNAIIGALSDMLTGMGFDPRLAASYAAQGREAGAETLARHAQDRETRRSVRFGA